ncbi:hypothetical protein O4H49_10695 [Kiloniella laminariae]|uniref:Uncharacterized protein n=1 Tax=Kiloniella laminariae TaxID=454162 RepID=A0ABT4LMQ8_9PROT|nr:hypothetical protein [Kiloniella laminariae]MCZ4281247.1 hypothetical protein [Kiloniella laminariae]
MIKWIALGDILFGSTVLLYGYYNSLGEAVEYFGFAVTLIGGLLFLAIRTLEKRGDKGLSHSRNIPKS